MRNFSQSRVKIKLTRIAKRTKRVWLEVSNELFGTKTSESLWLYIASSGLNNWIKKGSFMENRRIKSQIHSRHNRATNKYTWSLMHFYPDKKCKSWIIYICIYKKIKNILKYSSATIYSYFNCICSATTAKESLIFLMDRLLKSEKVRFSFTTKKILLFWILFDMDFWIEFHF
jgi:hypothetical protein